MSELRGEPKVTTMVDDQSFSLTPGWHDEAGWIGPPLPWRRRNFWCKFGLHRWGAPWCMECGVPDEILQGIIHEKFEQLRKDFERREDERACEQLRGSRLPPDDGA